jgi:hypothetical protein
VQEVPARSVEVGMNHARRQPARFESIAHYERRAVFHLAPAAEDEVKTTRLLSRERW